MSEANFEKKVKNLRPTAIPVIGIAGWGIQVPGVIWLTVCRHSNLTSAWRHAWHVLQSEEGTRRGDYESD